MNEFQYKRLFYFKKAAQEYGWVRLSPQDIEAFSEIIVNSEKLAEQYAAGYQDGYDACFLEHGPTMKDEETEEFLKRLDKNV